MNEDEGDWAERSRRALRSAEVLLNDGDPDGAAGRAYYPMFMRRRPCSFQRALSFPSTAAFGQEFTKPGLLPANLHRALIDAYASRLEGDYERQMSVSEETARTHVADAHVFIAAAAAYLPRS